MCASVGVCSCVGESGVCSRPREAADLANSAVGLRPEVEQRRTGLGREEEVTLRGRRREGVRLGVDLLEVALHGQEAARTHPRTRLFTAVPFHDRSVQ